MIPRNFDDVRKKQIDTLKIFNDNVNEIIENQEYSVQFESDSRPITLKIILGNQFPNEKPLLQLVPALKHSWCNSMGYIEQAPGLLNYSPQHSDLGRVVQAIIREYEKHPPPLIETPEHSSKESSPNESISPNSTRTREESASSSSDNEAKYSILKEYGLQNLSFTQIEQLSSNDCYLEDFVEELPIVRNLNETLDSNMKKVEIIAKENVAKEQHLNTLKSKLLEDVQTMKNLGENFEKLNQQFMKESEKYSPQNIRELLQIESTNSDSECEGYVAKFLSGELEHQQFINLFIEMKKLSVLRKAKEERLGHQLNALERAGY